MIILGVLLVGAAVGWEVNAIAWTNHSERVGGALVHRFLNEHSLSSPVEGSNVSTPAVPPGMVTLASCAQSSASDPVKGLLEIPKLGVTAPVEQGVDDSVLNVAVGHITGSVWPGDTGNSVLEAHDVSYFVHLAELSPGDTIRYVTPCITYAFSVQTHAVVQQGSPVYNTSTPTMTLVTCWPTDALWFTPQRYLVTANLVSSSLTRPVGDEYVPSQPPPAVPVPSQLEAEGVTLETYSVPMGAMSLGGSPDAAWAQTTNPLLVESSAVKAFIAGVRALTQDRLDWWSAFAPQVAPPAALVGAHNPSYLSPLNVAITADGMQATGVTLTTNVSISGGSAPGHHSMTINETVANGALLISSWSVS